MGNLGCQDCSCTSSAEIYSEMKRVIVEDRAVGLKIGLGDSQKEEFHRKILKESYEIKKIMAIYPFDNNHSKGFLYMPHNFLYEGQIKENKMNGQGKLKMIDINPKIIYQGLFHNNKLHGKGQLSEKEFEHQDATTVKGLWKDNYPSRLELRSQISSNHYEKIVVEFDDARLNKGKIRFQDGNIYHGEFEYNVNNTLYEASGKGKLTYANGNVLTGSFINGYLQGHGIFQSNSGEMYDGQFNKGKFNGYGTFTFKNKNKLQINWTNNKPEGQGNFYIKGTSQIIFYKNGSKRQRKYSQESS